MPKSLSHQKKKTDEKSKKSKSKSSASPKTKKTHSDDRNALASSKKQIIIEELSDDFDEDIISNINWKSHTPPRAQCMYMVNKKKGEKADWDQEFGGRKRKTKTRRRTSRKNKFFFW